MQIGKVTLKNNIFLAPMAGYTDIAMRRLIRDFGAGLTVTEMVSCKGLCFESKNTAALLNLAPNEKPSCVQLFGCEPDFFVRAIEKEELKDFDLVDINMGCPMPKITKNGEGSALLDCPEKIEKIVTAAAKTGRDITVKIRLGTQEDRLTAVRNAKIIEESGAKMLTVHGRFASWLYSGSADWDEIARVKSAVKIPVIGNGDILSALDAKEKIQKYKVDGVMIGRAAAANPFIISELCGGEANLSLKQMILRFYGYMTEYFDERYVVSNIKKHLAGFLKGSLGIKEIKQSINLAKTLLDIDKIIEQIPA